MFASYTLYCYMRDLYCHTVFRTASRTPDDWNILEKVKIQEEYKIVKGRFMSSLPGRVARLIFHL